MIDGLAGNGKLEQGADLLLRGAKSLENFVGEPDRRKQKAELNKKAAELIPISLEPIAKVGHGCTSRLVWHPVTGARAGSGMRKGYRMGRGAKTGSKDKKSAGG